MVHMYVFRFGVALFNSFLLLSALQLALIVIKITSQFTFINWGAVLSPLWLFLAFFCVLPCCQDVGNFRMDPVLYFGCMLVLWVPFVIFFICLAVKLQTRDPRISIALIFVPMWVIEGFFMVLNVVYLAVGIMRSVTHDAVSKYVDMYAYICFDYGEIFHSPHFLEIESNICSDTFFTRYSHANSAIGLSRSSRYSIMICACRRWF